VIEPKRDVEIDLLRWVQVVQSARIEKLARTRILGVVANVLHKQARQSEHQRPLIDPGSPIDKNLYDLPPAEAKEVKSTPGSLDQALDALERDHAFLLRGDVFTRDVIETWKRSTVLYLHRHNRHPRT
jgi:hypothetical protein